jgi:pantetheine-phosphate adenylyltransferase
MRIIAGTYRGRVLPGDVGDGVRPATDKVRGAIFNILQNRLDLRGIDVLDLFAGTGSLGFESLSRGARSATFVDIGRAAVRAIRENAAALACEDDCEISQSDAAGYVSRRIGIFGLIFADPPYAYDRISGLPGLILGSGMLAKGGYLIVEHRKGTGLHRTPRRQPRRQADLRKHRGLVFPVHGGHSEEQRMRTVLYPGTFDPVTYGHLDVIDRAARLFDRVVVLVARNAGKHPLFTEEERVEMIRRAVRGRRNIRVDIFDGLLVRYAKKAGAVAIVRGLRAVSDFEYEFQMALTNRKLANDVTTVFLMPHEKYTYLNSSIVREVAGLGGDVGGFVPPHVRRMLAAKFAGARRKRR